MSIRLDPETGEALVSAARTALGDAVRSVVYFTPDEFQLLYLRQDLASDGDTLREFKESLVDGERAGFELGPRYSDISLSPGGEPEIGEYVFTIRVFSEGYVVPVLVGSHGVLLTTDALDVDDFEEAAIAIRRLLADATGTEPTPTAI